MVRTKSFSQSILRSAAVLLGTTGLVSLPAHADDDHWQMAVRAGQATPGGWVRVRENAIQGTQLPIHDGLGVNHMQTIRLDAWKPPRRMSRWGGCPGLCGSRRPMRKRNWTWSTGSHRTGRRSACVVHRYLGQDERSREDGNVIHLSSNGIGLGVGYQF